MLQQNTVENTGANKHVLCYGVQDKTFRLQRGDRSPVTSNGRGVTLLLKIMSGVIDRKGNDHRSSAGPVDGPRWKKTRGPGRRRFRKLRGWCSRYSASNRQETRRTTIKTAGKRHCLYPGRPSFTPLEFVARAAA